jgi:hypothetical protein
VLSEGRVGVEPLNPQSVESFDFLFSEILLLFQRNYPFPLTWCLFGYWWISLESSHWWLQVGELSSPV